MNKVNFSCTSCGRCCHDLRLTLSVSEAIQWLHRGGKVQILCHAAADLDDLSPVVAYRSARSFPARSGGLAIRVQVILAAHFDGACPNLLPDMRCGIYGERPNTCRIYPAEIIPGLALKRDRKLCPPEAWDDRQPEYLSADGRILDVVTDTAIDAARAVGLREVGMHRALATALGMKIAALENEGFAVWSIPSGALLPILREAMQKAGDPSKGTPSPDWLFVSPRPETLALITAAGAKAVTSPNHDQVAYLPLY
jgi:Fe-S-cluster containining protein